MPIHVVEERKKDRILKDEVGDFTDAQIADALDALEKLPGYPANPAYVLSVFPVLSQGLNAWEMDFGRVKQDEVSLSDLFGTQNWVERDRVAWHVQHPGERQSSKAGDPFTAVPLIAAGLYIIDGHHTITALWLLGVKKVPVNNVPFGLASGHHR